MCGICGFNGPRAVDETKLRWLLVENLSRGRDSTGVYGNHLYKDNVVAPEFIQQPGFRSSIKGAKAVIGHTRQGTYGAKTKDNAHPFLYGDTNDPWAVVGVHNGFIIDDSLKHLTKKFEFTKDFDVDSQIIFAAINKFQNVDVISSIDGAMAIAFILPNKDKNTLYLYKRGETRDLHLGEHTDGLYFCSLAEPLKLIGCNKVYAAQADVLYTIKDGQIVDIYSMPEPIVKSLPVNAQRTNWRVGVPSAEINAHHKNVGTVEKSTVYGTGATTTRSHYTPHNYDSNKAKLLSEYTGDKSKDNVEGKFHMLMNTLRKEIEDLGLPEPVQYTSSASWENSDISGCLLTFNIQTLETHDGLAAWAVLHKENSDIAGLTTVRGLTAMKIPYTMCNTEQKFLVYDPVDGKGGPYVITVIPQAGRVLEVTLHIPFQEKQSEEKVTSPLSIEFEHELGSCNLSTEKSSLFTLGSDKRWGDGGSLSKDSELLRNKTSSVSGRSKKEETTQIPLSFEYSESVPETDVSAVKRDFARVKSELLPYTQSAYRDQVLEYLLDIRKDSLGNRIYNTNHALQVYYFKLAFDNADRNIWLSIYKTFWSKYIDAHRLIDDATMCLGWDRQNYKSWMKLPVYIEMLLQSDRLVKYFTSTALAQGQSENLKFINEILPSSMASVYSNRKDKKKVKHTTDYPANKLNYRDYVLLLKWSLQGDKILESMSTENVKAFHKNLVEYSDNMGKLLEQSNKAIQESETFITGQTSIIELKKALVDVRNFIRNEKEDVDDLLSQIDYKISKGILSSAE